jgi:hypothetical protein
MYVVFLYSDDGDELSAINVPDIEVASEVAWGLANMPIAKQFGGWVEVLSRDFLEHGDEAVEEYVAELVPWLEQEHPVRIFRVVLTREDQARQREWMRREVLKARKQMKQGRRALH